MAGSAFPTPAQLFDLTGQVALVTGASKGLGWAMARALAGAGAHVVLAARGGDAVQARAGALRVAGLSATPLPLDVGEAGAAVQAVDRIVADHGRLDILISNVAGSVRKPFDVLSEDEWHRVLNTGVTAGWRLARAAAAPMRRAGYGRMIFTSSVMGAIVRPDVSAYSVAKSGLEGLVRSLAVELGPDEITANAIAPGYFLTDGNAPLRREKPEFQDRIAARTALRRWGDPVDMMTPALYLAAPASRYTTGSVLMVDGGMTVTI